MRNKQKGQALIEFVLILPMLLLVTLGIFDYVNIQNKKYELSNHLDYISELYLNKEITKLNNYVKENNLILNTNKEDIEVTITLKKSVDLIAPGLNIILDDPFIITVKKVVYDE